MRLILLTFCLAWGCVSSGCSLFCPTPPPLLSELSWSTPERAVETYRKAFATENANYEFLTLSDALKQKYGIGFGEYSLGRGRFLDANRGLVDLMLEAEVTATRRLPGTNPEQVAVRVERDGHFAEFILVNEPVAWIKFMDGEDEITIDIPLDSLERVIVVKGKRIVIDGLPEAPAPLPDEDTIHEVRVTKRWRLFEIAHLSKSLQAALTDE